MPTGLLARSDEELILACRGAPLEHARALVGELARRHLERLASFICGITGDSAAALDLAQEAFVRVYKHRDNYKEVARFTTWLYTIGRNLALNEIRNRKRRPLAGAGGDDSNEAGALATAPARTEGPSAAAEKADVATVVRAAVAELPDHYRTVVILCDLEGRTYAEAAEVLEVPVGTIRSRLSRAREQLERRLRGVIA
jgi:RNA polymerase sigma-70 factor (ECF subfamily)